MKANRQDVRAVAGAAGARPEAAVRAPMGSRLQLRRRQHLPIERFASGEIVRVERGCALLQAVGGEGWDVIAQVLFAGDVITREAAPPLAGLVLMAVAPTTLVVMRSNGNDGAAPEEARLADAFARLASQSALHAITLNRLTAEQRVATFLVEMALRFGSRTPAGCTFEVPLSRTDLAHYLALNPDTMSRLMSRLKSAGLVTAPSRGWATVPSVEKLAALTPLAGALARLWPTGGCTAPLDRERASAR